jgi:type VI secretion system protein ImpA
VALDVDLDIADLLKPFEGEVAAGTDPREDASAQSLYYRLRDARAEARDAERRADGDTADSGASPQQWRTVRDLSIRILRERAKDLEVAAWLTEALVREGGLAGLTGGARVISGLVGEFWDSGLFPTPDEDGLTTLVMPISGLSGVTGEGTLAQAIRKQAMFTRGDGSDLTFWEYFQAEEVEKIGDAPRKKARLETGVMPFATVETEAKAAGAGHFAQLRNEVDEAILAWTQMTAVLDEKAGSDAPSTGRVRDLLGELLAAAARFAPARAEPVEAVEEAGDAAENAGSAGGAVAVPVTARVVNRDDMLNELSKIADYFRKSEPQSPLSLTLDEAVRRARLSWPELLEEVMENEDTRNTMLVNLGIRPRKKAE